MIRRLVFWVPGEPRPKGSWRGIVGDAGGVVMRNSSKGVPQWQRDIGMIALGEKNKQRIGGLAAGNVTIGAHFVLPEKSNPDLDKLIRAVLDALTGVIYDDDKRVCRIEAEKTHRALTDPPQGAGVWINVSLDDTTCVSEAEVRQKLSRRRATASRRR